MIKLDISKDGELSLSSLAIPEAPVQKFTYTADGSFVSEDGSTKLNLVTEDNGRTYLWVRAYSAIPGLGQMAMSEYQAEKLEPNELSKDVAKAWEAREGKTYFLVSEKYTSQAYFMQPPIAYIATLKDMPGYLMANKITGANEALNLLNIPTFVITSYSIHYTKLYETSSCARACRSA